MLNSFYPKFVPPPPFPLPPFDGDGGSGRWSWAIFGEELVMLMESIVIGGMGDKECLRQAIQDPTKDPIGRMSWFGGISHEWYFRPIDVSR